MTYQKLEIIPFGKSLLETGDLDPVYIALHKANFEREILANWLVAYWCLYSCGVVSWIAEQKNFWEALMRAAENKTPTPVGGPWPRGTERRHWRGRQAITSAEYLHRKWDKPIDMVSYISQSKTVEEVMSKAQEYVGFGPWISYKIADMIDRCWGHKVDFDESIVFMFDSPRNGADLLWSKRNKPIPKDNGHREEVVTYLINIFKRYKAPPQYDRPVNIQEVETILCKWYSHMNGHYPIGKDIREIRHGLESWSKISLIAYKFLKCMPAEIEEAEALV